MQEEWMLTNKRADFFGIAEKYNIDPVIARIIRNRDVIEESDIEAFIHADIADMHNPSLMKDMDKGCEIIKQKIVEGKSIRVIADYDVDGVMSGYILLDGLKNAGANVSIEIPDRILDGYGINERIINDANTDNIDTIITCDNGISAHSAIKLAKDYGMTVVVTDHHVVKFELVNDKKVYNMVAADAIIDPMQEDCDYPFKGICGAVVAYKFIRNLYKHMNIEWPDQNKYIEMAAIATVCDIMDLKNENRAIVKTGIACLRNTKNVGLRALMQVNDMLGKTVSSYQLGFVIGPCINATGRLQHAKKGIELLCCEDESEALKLAQELKDINNERKDLTVKGTEEAFKIVEEQLSNDDVLVVYVPGLHESLAGIVAGRIKEKYYKPTFVVTDAESSELKGSGRSIEGYNMVERLIECEEYLVKFGGHELAAGISLSLNKLDAFRKALNEKSGLTEEILTPKLKIDVPMPISYISIPFIEQLQILEPFGKGNPKPVFAQLGWKIKRATVYNGTEKTTVRLIFQDKDGYSIDAVVFEGNKFLEDIKMWFTEEECGKMLRGLPNDISLDVAYCPEINEYMGRRSIQIKNFTYRKHEG